MQKIMKSRRMPEKEVNPIKNQQVSSQVFGFAIKKAIETRTKPAIDVSSSRSLKTRIALLRISIDNSLASCMNVLPANAQIFQKRSDGRPVVDPRE